MCRSVCAVQSARWRAVPLILKILTKIYSTRRHPPTTSKNKTPTHLDSLLWVAFDDAAAAINAAEASGFSAEREGDTSSFKDFGRQARDDDFDTEEHVGSSHDEAAQQQGINVASMPQLQLRLPSGAAS